MACEDLYMESPSGSEYEAYGLEQPWEGEASGSSYGDDPYLDGLYDECEAGDFGACRTLYMETPVGSEYEAAGREGQTELGTYGNDHYFDSLYEDCEDGETEACEDLYAEAPLDSEYEKFGLEQLSERSN